MERRWVLFGGVGMLLLGYFLGQSAGPVSIEFPDPAAARDAAQMEREVSEALSEPRAFPRSSALIRLFEGLTQENVVGASRAVEARAGGWDPVDLQLFLTAWIHLDPLAAVRAVEGWPIKSRREIGLKIAIREWAASGHQLEAVGYVQSINDPETRAMAAGPLVRGWALAGDTGGALALAHRLWTTGEKLDVVDGLVRGVLQVQGPEGALRMMRSVDALGPGAGDFEERLVNVTLSLAGREDPPAAAAAYSELVAGGTPAWLQGSLGRLAVLWRNDDAKAALLWVLPHAPSAERSRALTETVGTWANRDFEAAWEWFQAARGPFEPGLALSADDSSLVTGIVRRMSRNDPVLAAEWVVRIQDGEQRMVMLKRVAHFWSRQDSPAAMAWIEAQALSDSDAAVLRNVAIRAAEGAATEEEAKLEARQSRIDSGEGDH